MQHYQDVLQDRSGNAIAGAIVTVLYNSTSLPASLYADYAGTQPLTTVITDADGSYSFYVSSGRYDYAFYKNGKLLKTQDDVFVDESTALQDLSAPTGASLVGFNPTGTISATTVQNAISETNTDLIAGLALKTNIADLAATTGSALVGFQQTGTGAVARTVDAKQKESVSVKDFGAVGNGIADDTVAIQAAINYIKSVGGGVVKIPYGTYYVTATLVINFDNCVIKGEGMQTAIKRNTNYGDTFYVGTDGVRTIVSGGTYLALTYNNGIYDLRVDTLGAMTNGAHFHFRGASQLTVENIYTNNGFIHYLFESTTASNCSKIYATWAFTGNLYGGTVNGRMFMKFTTPADIGGLNFIHPGCGNNKFTDFTTAGPTTQAACQYGIYIDSADGIWFENGHLGTTATADLFITATNASASPNLLFFTNCMFDASDGYGTLFQGATVVGSNIQFSNCNWKGGARATTGIATSPTAKFYGVQFNNCFITEYQRDGVLIQSPDCSKFHFNDCSIRGNNYYGYANSVTPGAGNGALALNVVAGGSGYIDGSYINIQLTYISGLTATQYARADFTVSGGAITGVAVHSPGNGYQDTSTVMGFANSVMGGVGSGGQIGITSITIPQYTGYHIAACSNMQIVGGNSGGFNTDGTNSSQRYGLLIDSTASITNLLVSSVDLTKNLIAPASVGNLAKANTTLSNIITNQTNVIPSASSIDLPLNNNVFVISGTTQINSIVTQPLNKGIVSLVFDSDGCIVADSVSGINGALRLNGPFTSTIESSLSLVQKDTYWVEISRSELNSGNNFTPELAIGGSSVGITYSTGGQFGSYSIVGRMVFFSIQIFTTALGGLTGNLSITGLPFVSYGAITPVVATITAGLPLPAQLILSARVANASQIVDIYKSAASGSVVQLTHADINAATNIFISGFYNRS